MSHGYIIFNYEFDRSNYLKEVSYFFVCYSINNEYLSYNLYDTHSVSYLNLELIYRIPDLQVMTQCLQPCTLVSLGGA
jgi:hypothetical protein